MTIRKLLFLTAIIGIILLGVLCAKRSSPYQNTSNARVELIVPTAPDTGYLVGDSILIGTSLILAHLTDSINLMLGTIWDTTIIVGTQEEQDTLWAKVPLLIAGSDTIEVTMYLEDGALRQTITVISVRGLPITFLSDLPGQAGGKVGESITLHVAVSGSGPFSYAWHKDGAALSGQTKDTLLLANLQPGNAGNYFCVVTDGLGKKDTSRITVVTVKPLATPDPPASILIAEETDLHVKLVWNSVDSATGYKVYKDTIEHGIVNAVTQVTDTSYIIEHQSQTWYFWVTAIKNGLESLPSTAIKWSPNPSKLYPPQNVSAARIDSATVRVKWDSVSNATSYVVYHNANRNTAGYTSVIATDTFYNHATKFNYYYYVIALNASDTSLPSDTVKTVDSTTSTPGLPKCKALTPGASINASIKELYASTDSTNCLSLAPGLYDNNLIRVYGKVQIVIE